MKKIFTRKNQKKDFLTKTSLSIKKKKTDKKDKTILKSVLQKIEILELNKNIGDILSINFINEFRILLNNLEKIDFQGRDLVLKIESLEQSEILLREYENLDFGENEFFESFLEKDNMLKNDKKNKNYKKKNFGDRKNSCKNGRKKLGKNSIKKKKREIIVKKMKKLESKKIIRKEENEDYEKNQIFDKTKIFMYNSKTAAKQDKNAGFEDIFSKFEKTIKKKNTIKNPENELENEIFKNFRNLNEDLKNFLQTKKKKRIPKNIFFEEFLSLVDILFFNINKKDKEIFLEYDFISQIKKEFSLLKKKILGKNDFTNLYIEINKFSTLIDLITENFCYQSLIF